MEPIDVLKQIRAIKMEQFKRLELDIDRLAIEIEDLEKKEEKTYSTC